MRWKSVRTAGVDQELFGLNSSHAAVRDMYSLRWWLCSDRRACKIIASHMTDQFMLQDVRTSK